MTTFKARSRTEAGKGGKRNNQSDKRKAGTNEGDVTVSSCVMLKGLKSDYWVIEWHWQEQFLCSGVDKNLISFLKNLKQKGKLKKDTIYVGNSFEKYNFKENQAGGWRGTQRAVF